MEFFKRILGKQYDENGEKMAIYYVSGDDDYMEKAFYQARESFGYFWRELYWEARRIAPALSFAALKICFKDEIEGEEVCEHMWINDVYFDGEKIYGVLVNEPNDVQNVKNGDEVEASLEELSDWMFCRDWGVHTADLVCRRSALG